MSDGRPELPTAYNLVHYEEVDELRGEARKLCEQGAEEGTLLWCDNQRNPLGRNGQPWIPGTGNLHCTVILRPEFSPGRYPQLLLVAAVSMGNALAAHLTPMISLAYGCPDDIRIAGHKVASIWIDCDPYDTEPWLCVTTSVNILSSPEDFSIPAISVIEAEGHTTLTAPALLESFARQFISLINLWSEPEGFDRITRLWLTRAETVGKTTSLQLDNEILTGKFEGLSSDGDLFIKPEDGPQTTVELSRLVNYAGSRP